MIKELKFIINNYKAYILMLGFAYGATIVFPAFGPVLKISSGTSLSMMSTLAFLCYVIGFLLPEKYILTYTKNYRIPYLIIIVIAPSIMFFDKISDPMKWMVLLIFALFAGSIGHLWTFYFHRQVPNQYRGRVSALTISLSFFILYSCTILVDYVSLRVALFLPILLIFLSVHQNTSIQNIISKVINSDVQTDYKPTENISFQIQPWTLYAFFVIIYISGGFTYAGLFPKFESYTFIAKYYNVQPLFLTVILAGLLADKIGRKNMLYIGFGFVGLSFTTFMLPAGYASYLATQTFSQIGWGFVNTAVWVISADIAHVRKEANIASRGVASMLFGTVIGATIAYLINHTSLNESNIYGFITHVPIFLSLTMIGLIPETLVKEDRKTSGIPTIKTQGTNSNIGADNNSLTPDTPRERLTAREQEIADLLIKDYSRTQICSKLNISINTLKTHIRHIYKKLGISNKNALKVYMTNN